MFDSPDLQSPGDRSWVLFALADVVRGAYVAWRFGRWRRRPREAEPAA